MKPAFHDHFSEVARRYADYRPQYPQALFEYLAAVAPKGAKVWDCAAGTGQATAGLARVFKTIVATDASAEQIAQARPHERIEFRVATAEQSGLADASVGMVTVAQALHWFDLDRFYAEVRRVLCPGGVLAVWSYGVHRAGDPAIDRIIMEFYSDIVGPYWPPERAIVEQGYRTIAFPFAELSPPAFQMETTWTLEQLMGYFGTWSATQRYIKARGESPLGALSESLSAVWGGAAVERRIQWPLALRVGRLGEAK